MSSQSELDRALDFALSELDRAGKVGRLSPPLRTVVLVHSALGIIDNGGLQYLFESDFPERPPYAVFVEAYRTIGAVEAADHLEAAVDSFPLADPHLHRERRNEFLDSQHAEESIVADAFWDYDNWLCGDEYLWECLEKNVGLNKSCFNRSR